jgi:hypothetical protein
MFTHKIVEIQHPAKQITQDGTGKRLYQTPFGDVYPSITTVLSPMKEEILAAWRKRVGDKVADFESQWGKDRGTAIHEAIELVLKNKSIVGHPLLVRMIVQDLMPYLHLIDNILAQEQALFSNKFRIAGRCDTIAEYKGILSVIDFKGSKRPKKREWIEDYFIQTSFYAAAFFEQTGIKIPQCVILIGTEQGQPQEFIIRPWDYWDQLKEVREIYRQRENI